MEDLKLKLLKLQAKDSYAKKIQAEFDDKQGLKKDWEKDLDERLCYPSVSYILKIIQTELISGCYNDLLAGYFGIKKIWELIVENYYWSILGSDV